MRVLVTGAAGYLGGALVAALRTEPAALGTTIDAMLLTDRRIADVAAGTAPATPVDAAIASDQRIEGDITDASLIERLFAAPVDVVFHFAGIVSGAAEADYALGRRVNLDATLALVEACRLQAARGGPVVRFVYASSIAVFGVPLPTRLDDATAPAPTLSYGTHKRCCELVLDDATRRGFVDGRALRFSGVVVRPPLANGALSGFNSDLIREPLAGARYVCPVGPDATIWIVSRARAIANLIALARAPSAALGPRRALTMPSLAVRIADVVEAIRRADPDAAARIAFRPAPALEAQFGRWPLDCAFERGVALGLAADVSIDAVIEQHLGAGDTRVRDARDAVVGNATTRASPPSRRATAPAPHRPEPAP